MKKIIGTHPFRVNVADIVKGVYQSHLFNPADIAALKCGKIHPDALAQSKETLTALINEPFDEIDQGLFKSSIDEFVADLLKEMSKQLLEMVRVTGQN